MPIIKQDRIIFNEQDWLRGEMPIGFNAKSDSSKIDNYLTYLSNFNPYRQLGYAAPGYLPSSVTNASSISNRLIASSILGNYAYCFEDGTKLHQAAYSSGNITSDATWPHTITGATGQDVKTYYVNISSTKTQCILYSYKTATNGDIGLYDGSTFNDTFMSTTPASAATMDTTNDHPMIVGDDDALYIGDGNNLHKFDGQTGADGTLTKNRLTIPSNYTITSFAKITPRTLVIYASTNASDSAVKAGQSMAFFWDYLNDDPYKVVEINQNYVRAGFNFNGTIGCFGYGRNVNSTDSRKMLLYDAASNKFKIEVSYDKDLPVNGGVYIIDNLIMWNGGGTAFAYGNQMSGLPFAFNRFFSGAGSYSGILTQFGATNMMISSGSSTSGGLENAVSNYALGQVDTSFATPYFPKGKMGQITAVKTRFGKTSSGGRALQLYLRDRNATSSIVFDSLEDITSSTMVKEQHNDKNGNSFFIFDTLQCHLDWSTGSGETDAPIVGEVEVFYKQINIEK